MAELASYKLTQEDLSGFWRAELNKARAAKQQFDKEATTMETWYGKRHDHFYPQDISVNSFNLVATVNKVFEAIRIFQPELMFKAPEKRVYCENPELTGWCQVAEKWLNKLTSETDWKRAAKRATFEAQLYGCGAHLTEFDPISKLVVSSFFTIKDILVDPSARSFDEALWIALGFDVPRWVIEQRFGKEVAKSVKAVEKGATTTSKSKRDGAKPTVHYDVIYSKMGMGIRDKAFADDAAKERINDLDNVKLVVSPDYPRGLLALPGPWETPFWMDYRAQSWPISFLWFTERPGSLWPMSHLQPAIGVQEALDYLVTHILQHVKVTSKEIIAIMSSVSENLRKALEQAGDLAVVEIIDPTMQDINKLVQVLQFRPMNPDVWRAVELLTDLWEKLTGVSDILYGQTRHAFRSATEAEMKERHARSTPEEMLDRVEDWCSEIVRKEIICSRWHDEIQESVGMMLGPQAADIWGQYREDDIERLVREVGYGVQVGSSRKPNPEKKQQDADMVFQGLFPLYQALGAVDKLNVLIGEWTSAHGVENPEKYQITPQDIPAEEEGEQGGQGEAPAATEG